MGKGGSIKNRDMSKRQKRLRNVLSSCGFGLLNDACIVTSRLSFYLQSGNAVSKGGLWTVDPDYRRSLLAALKRSPYHPYHSYFTPPLSPRYMSCSVAGFI